MLSVQVLHIPPSLVRHVTQELRKPLIIILNKVDFVPVPLAVAWKRYLCEKFPGIHVVFFTSFPRDVYREEELMDFSNTKSLSRLLCHYSLYFSVIILISPKPINSELFHTACQHTFGK